MKNWSTARQESNEILTGLCSFAAIIELVRDKTHNKNE